MAAFFMYSKLTISLDFFFIANQHPPERTSGQINVNSCFQIILISLRR